ncbi:MAG: fumarylacetoacetate hydrolase family protein [Bradyrhizobiaceae bacterium]|nr:fumarylacetoacetate hydrolase family protein [Bradyrhizobiaceae bacterium]
MKLASFRFNGRDRLGFASGDGLIDLEDAARAMGRPALPVADMIELIESGDAGLRLVREASAFALQNPAAVARINAADVQWHPPVRRPSKILGIALNNTASDERKISAPEHPMFFMKPASSLVGHRGEIIVHGYYGSVHPEPELAVVIGKECRAVKAENAYDVVYGYSIFNDMTGNAMRAEDRVHYYALYPRKDDPTEVERVEQHLSYAARYKGSDTFGPMGPWLVTKDEIPDPHALEVRCWHKDELIAEDSTAYYKYPVPQAIEFITRFHSLWPGDVISMGTAFRPGSAKRSLHTADVTRFGGPLRVEITGLGTLENPVRRIDP